MNASTLATLPTRNKNHFLSSFIQQQQHFLQQYINEGQRVARSWDVSKSVSPPASPKNNPQLGFGTPVLRARLDLVSTRIDCPINKDHGQTGGGQECLKKNERQLAHNVKSQHDLKSKERQKKNISRTDKKRSKENSLLSDSEHETVQRHADRRRRKKTKRDMLNPVFSGDSDNASTTRKIRKQAKSRSKLRQEFALMHGFSSTNVGKNRLTLEPGRRDIGVFQKGKASRKTDVVQAGKRKRQELGCFFSEATFLSKPHPKVSKIDLEKVAKILAREDESTIASSASASIPRSTKARTEMEIKSKEFKESKTPSKSNLVTNRKLQTQDKAMGYNPADSAVWDIERTELLGSEVSSGMKQGSIVLELDHLPSTSNKVPGNGMLDTTVDTLEAHLKLSQHNSVTQPDVLSSPSLGPSQSASQIGSKAVNLLSLPTVSSKYFKISPPRLVESHPVLTRYQLDTKPCAFSELGELSTIEDTIPQANEPPVSRLHRSTCPSVQSYCDTQEGRPNPIPPIQPSYDSELSVYNEGYLFSELWPPMDHPADWCAERLDNIDDKIDHVSVDFDGQTKASFDIPADDEILTLDYIACGKLDEMDHTPFVPLSEHQSMELHNPISPSIWLSDTYSDVSERCPGVAYQESDLGSEDQQIQPDSDFDLDHEGVSSMDSEPYPDVVHHFWQGRSLLYGLSVPGEFSSLHKLSNVEAVVARQLPLDHWLPQKL